jgi:uncharacterized protein YndB with AHSA1/START domain
VKNKLVVNTDVPNEIHMTRTFDAPRHLVIEAMTKPDLIKRWLGGKRATVTHAECDLRVGGSYKWVFLLPDGSSFYFSGTFREVSPERVVHNERFNEDPNESLVTTTYSERAGQTTVTWVIRFATQAVRDMVLATGMADGAAETYDSLDELFASRPAIAR